MPLFPYIMIKSFEKWAIDFVGPINPTSMNKRHILVCTDFVTNWVEAKTISFATEKFVVEILFSEIFTRFGVPREIVNDNGQQFIFNLVEEFMDQFKILQRESTLYHP